MLLPVNHFSTENLSYFYQNIMMHTVPVTRALYDHLGTVKDLEQVLYYRTRLKTKIPVDLYYMPYFTYN